MFVNSKSAAGCVIVAVACLTQAVFASRFEPKDPTPRFSFDLGAKSHSPLPSHRGAAVREDIARIWTFLNQPRTIERIRLHGMHPKWVQEEVTKGIETGSHTQRRRVISLGKPALPDVAVMTFARAGEPGEEFAASEHFPVPLITTAVKPFREFSHLRNYRLRSREDAANEEHPFTEATTLETYLTGEYLNDHGFTREAVLDMPVSQTIAFLPQPRKPSGEVDYNPAFYPLGYPGVSDAAAFYAMKVILQGKAFRGRPIVNESSAKEGRKLLPNDRYFGADDVNTLDLRALAELSPSHIGHMMLFAHPITNIARPAAESRIILPFGPDSFGSVIPSIRPVHLHETTMHAEHSKRVKAEPDLSRPLGLNHIYFVGVDVTDADGIDKLIQQSGPVLNSLPEH